MAGYQDDFSRSNNAADAEDRGMLPASRLAKRLRVSPAAVRSTLSSNEWHHTSARYNCTDYYDGEVLVALVCPRGWRKKLAACRDIVPEAYQVQQAVREYRAMLRFDAKRKLGPKRMYTWSGCTVVWLEWSGTRNRPKADECTLDGATVTWKAGAKMVSISHPDRPTFRKKIGTRSFTVKRSDQTIIADYMSEPALPPE